MQVIQQAIKRVVQKMGLGEVDFVVEHPKDEKNGDYASNVAMVLGKKIGKNPREVAQKIVDLIKDEKEIGGLVERVEVAGFGFVNFYLKNEWLWRQVLSIDERFGFNQNLANQKVMVEYTDPNPFKEMHIGHLMSNTIGEAIARLKMAEGAEVRRANYQGDVGLHVAKSIWGMKVGLADFGMVGRASQEWVLVLGSEQKIKENLKRLALESVLVRQRFLGQAYAYGATKYEEDEAVKAEIQRLNKVIYEGSDPFVMELYRAGRKWSLEYFEIIYRRLGTKFDEYFFESEAGPVGLEAVEEALAKGILEFGEEGAVVYRGEKDGLHTRVFRNKWGLPTYEAKDLGLAKTKYERYPYDQSIIVTANEITEYFRVVLTVMGQLYPDLRAKTIHKPHGIMKLPTGKMSSRTGKVVTAESLLNELREVVLAKIGERMIHEKEVVADQVAVGALKYAVLRQGIGGDIVYDPVAMTNLDGESGPYLQYTYARILSVLRKTDGLGESELEQKEGLFLSDEERAILRYLYRFPEVVEAAAKEFAPHLICGYLYELATRYNRFYNKHRIVDAEEGTREIRVFLSRATAQVLKNGLWLLGIKAPREM